MEKTGIIGSGVVGKTLAAGFLKHGFPVMIASRSAEKRAALREEIGGEIRTGDFADTAAYGEIIVLAVKGMAAKAAVKACGIAHLDGKIVIDATNPIADAPPQDGVLQYFTDTNRSLMEELQDLAPQARFVKAFNSVSSVNMVNPAFKESRPSMFLCGNDTNAKSRVTEILDIFGWDTEDMGTVVAARAIEPLAMLFCIHGFRKNEWTHAFRVMHMD